MASTYSTDYQITLMTTGEEAGSWGGITNDNLEKIGNSVGGSVVVNVTSPPSGGSWNGGTYVMDWVTENTSAKGTSGTSPAGSGRARFVVFADGGSMGDNITVNICGHTSSDKPERVFFAKNSLSDSRSITFKLAGSGSYVLANGKTALLFTNSVAKGPGSQIAANTVANILDAIQITSLTLQNGETISNAVDGTVAIDGATLKVGTGAAIATVRSSGAYDLELRGGDSDKAKIVVVDGTNGSISLEPDGTGVVSVVGTLDVTGAGGIILSNDETITNAVDGTIAFSGTVSSPVLEALTQVAAPSAPGDTTKGLIYTKVSTASSDTNPELYYRNASGIIRLTRNGSAESIEAGSKMVFYQSSAPDGWTLDATVNDKLLMVTDNSGGTDLVGGTAYSGAGPGGSSLKYNWTMEGVPGYALTVSQMPRHNHVVYSHAGEAGGTTDGASGGDSSTQVYNASSGYTGGSGSARAESAGDTHEHRNTNWRPEVAAVIICTKDAYSVD